MPKPKAFVKQSRNKKIESVLETADDYQAAGVEFEEAAGKHRAGDAAKSLRFFERAINTYEEGLAKFPTSFDLAYNKARVQFEIATHPRMAPQLQHPLVDVLKVALASHEYALKLDEDDADLLFNTSQVMTSIAEELANEESTEAAIGLLQTALQLQARCLTVQEQKYAETMEQEREAQKIFHNASNNDATADEIPIDEHSDVDSAKEERPGQWASVLEPVNARTLIDTALACLSTMTTLCTTIAVSTNQSWRSVVADLESQHSQLLSKIEGLSLNDPEGMHEMAVADAILQSAILDAAFMFNSLPAATYKEMLDRVWAADKPHLDLQATSDALIAHAHALIILNSSLSTMALQETPDTNDKAHLANLRWAALTTAIKSLTTASKTASISSEEKAKTHLLRGDTSFLQYRMSAAPIVHKEAAINAEILLKNAQIFYRNAVQLSSDQKDKERAFFRCAVVQQGSSLNLTFEIEQERRAAQELQDMLDEGLLLERTGLDGHALYV